VRAVPTDAPPLLRAEALRKTFGGVVALDGVSLEVPAGGIFGLIGPNGAGKTTLFNVVSGIYRATAGTVYLEGRRLDGLAQDRIARLGVARTFQNLQIFGSMTVLDNVLTGCHRHGHSGALSSMLQLPLARSEERRLRERARAALDIVGLSDLAAEPAASLPPGRQRVVEIARALATEPKLLLLDEPAAGLTTRETEVLGQLIECIAADGLTTMLIEHDMSLVMNLCGRVAVLDQGKLLTVGAPTEVQSDPRVLAAYLGEEAQA
jgi:branched-chain amino acid transport system ATP-binding protein